jgi:hypothetical protein
MIEMLTVYNKCTTARHNEVKPTQCVGSTSLCLGIVHILYNVSARITSLEDNPGPLYEITTMTVLV